LISFYEILRRTEEGPHIDEREFDLKVVARESRRLVREYDIRFNREEIVTSDDSLADDVFKAGFELALRAGFLTVDSRRVIKLSEEEIKEGLRTAPGELLVGQGADARLLYARKVEDSRYPVIMGGQAGAPIPEEFYYQMAISYMQEPIVDTINNGGLAEVKGIEVRTRSPAEALATMAELRYLREAARAAGRPGIHLLAGESSVTCTGDLAVQSEEFLRKTDAHLVPVLNDLKTDYDRLTKAFTFKIYGGFNVALVDPVVGGFLGGPEGVAVGFIASYLLSRVIYMSDYYIIHPIHPKYVSTSTPETMWVLNIVGQAMARNSNFILMGDVWTSNGAGTREVFYEIVANTVTNVVTGSHPLGVSATNGKYPHASGLETRFMGEVARAAVKLKRSDANEIVKEFLKKYHPERMDRPDIGKPFPELYDMKTITPKGWWLKMYEEARREVMDIGLKLG